MSTLSCGFKFELLVSMQSQFQNGTLISNRVSISSWTLRTHLDEVSAKIVNDFR